MMKLTSLLAAAALLVAAAPSASAACLYAVGCLGTQDVTDLAGEVTGTALGVVAIILGAAQDQVTDVDADGVPDDAEPLLCGNDLLYGLLNQEAVPGHCTTRTDYLPPDNLRQVLDAASFVVGTAMGAAEAVVAEAGRQAAGAQAIAEETAAFVEGRVDAAIALVDADGDSVADILEPVICGFVENQNVPQDGSCTADNQDYTPPQP